MDRLTASEIADLLNLQPNATCGSVRVTYTSAATLRSGALPPPLSAERPLGSALYFLVTPDQPVRPHRIRNDQLYHYYLGDPLELSLMHNDGTVERVTIGPEIKLGHCVQMLIPGNTFHTARLASGGDWFLGGSTEWPGVLPETDVEIGNIDNLIRDYPSLAGDLREIIASVK